uniref:HIT-type domain-containing protein n=1 Tax=Meleagris gallopavo TaxID=9103 RepID=A0A803XT27_MELGA
MAAACDHCAAGGAPYTCPRCNRRLCSLGCYRGHGACAEAFYREQVLRELSSQPPPEPSERARLRDAIGRLRDGAGRGEERGLWGRLSEEQKAEFRRMLKNGEAARLLPPWRPWWWGRRRLVEEIGEEGWAAGKGTSSKGAAATGGTDGKRGDGVAHKSKGAARGGNERDARGGKKGTTRGGNERVASKRAASAANVANERTANVANEAEAKVANVVSENEANAANERADSAANVANERTANVVNVVGETEASVANERTGSVANKSTANMADKSEAVVTNMADKGTANTADKSEAIVANRSEAIRKEEEEKGKKMECRDTSDSGDSGGSGVTNDNGVTSDDKDSADRVTDDNGVTNDDEDSANRVTNDNGVTNEDEDSADNGVTNDSSVTDDSSVTSDDEDSADAGDTDTDEDGADDDADAGIPGPTPPTPTSVPPLSSFRAPTPSPLLRFQLPNVLYGYAFALSLHVGDDSFLPDVAVAAVAVSAALRCRRPFSSTVEALLDARRSAEAAGYPRCPLGDAGTLMAVAELMRGRSRHRPTEDVETALYHMEVMLERAGRMGRGEERERLGRARRKCRFLLAWSRERGAAALGEMAAETEELSAKMAEGGRGPWGGEKKQREGNPWRWEA